MKHQFSYLKYIQISLLLLIFPLYKGFAQDNEKADDRMQIIENKIDSFDRALQLKMLTFTDTVQARTINAQRRVLENSDRLFSGYSIAITLVAVLFPLFIGVGFFTQTRHIRSINKEKEKLVDSISREKESMVKTVEAEIDKMKNQGLEIHKSFSLTENEMKIFRKKVDGQIKRITQEREHLFQERKEIDEKLSAYNTGLENTKTEIFSSLKKEELKIETTQKKHLKELRIEEEKLHNEIREYDEQTRVAFHEFHKDLIDFCLGIIDIESAKKRIPKARKVALLKHFQGLLDEHYSILGLYSDNLGECTKQLHHLLQIGTNKAKPHLEFLQHRLEYRKDEFTTQETDSLKIVEISTLITVVLYEIENRS